LPRELRHRDACKPLVHRGQHPVVRIDERDPHVVREIELGVHRAQ